jgi:glycosyltransferase involved in cell wall biosynthesis
MIDHPARAQEMGLAARERALKSFTRDAVIPQYEALYHRILGNTP